MPSSFGRIHVISLAFSEHTHTAIFLHDRGSDGEEFAEKFQDTKISSAEGDTDIFQKLPTWRWVFPSSQELWSMTFQEDLPAWFEAQSLADPTARQDAQIHGIRESVSYIKDIIELEIGRLDDQADKVVLGGISQGAAIGIWTLLCRRREGQQHLGAFVGVSAWLPFSENIDRVLATSARKEGAEDADGDAFVLEMMAAPIQSNSSFLCTPIFLGHGIDDAYVDIKLGQEVRTVLEHVGLTVEWKEYIGADQEGHWFKLPEEMEDIAEFLSKRVVIAGPRP